MTKNWLTIRVELLSGRAIEFDPAPGRILLVGPEHTFADLADAINSAFARWDLGHLHAFELANERWIGPSEADDLDFEEETITTVTSALVAGESFRYIFDFGDDWTHRCSVERDDFDPADEYGDRPDGIVAIWGWGSIPDQYGRERADEEGE